MSEAKAVLQAATFWVGESYFGIDVLAVREVVLVREMTTVPLAAPEISGIINLRGEIVTALDLRRRFGLEPAPDIMAQSVVVRARDSVVSLLVDAVDDVIVLDPDRFEPAPSTVRDVVGDVILGVYRLDDRLLQMIDVDAVVAVGALSPVS